MNNRFYSIKEASLEANLSTHTLRYWEKALKGIIVPVRTSGGQRRYTDEHLLLFGEIKRLKRKGLSLDRIYSELSAGSSMGRRLDQASVPVEHLADRIAEIVRFTVRDFFKGKR